MTDTLVKIRQLFEDLLGRYYSVHLAVGFHPEVVVPEYLKTDEWKERKSVIHLEYGLNLAVPIEDLKMTEEGVAATLSFQRTPYATYVPWAAVTHLKADGSRPETWPPRSRPSLKLVP